MAAAQLVSDGIHQELEEKGHPNIAMINVDSRARNDPDVLHKDLIAELLAQHQVPSDRTFVLSFIHDGNTEQYKTAKAFLMANGVPNQIIMQVQNLREPSLLLRNLIKQVLHSFSAAADLHIARGTASPVTPLTS
eukprot:GGOE01013993.1.p2 GENE.GGOE01013993.1~~GGOE01013993.1.p2  ORF type:complete len:135 (+),score=42.55 GGOE01013993.1:115-519(+)